MGDVRRRVALTTADQIFSSASNFAVGLAVARVSGPTGFGAYALAYAVWLFLVGINRSLVTDPLIIRGPLGADDPDRRVNGGLASAVTLGLAATAAVAAAGAVVYSFGERTLGLGLLGIAPWLVFLLVQDYWRWVGFMQGAPGKSLVNDVVFIVSQVLVYVAFVLTGNESPQAALAAWGAGAVLGSVLGLRQFSIRRPVRGVRRHFRLTWPTSRWLMGDNLTGWISSQAYVISVGVMLGPVGLAALRAAQTLTGPLGVLLQIGGSIGLPEAAQGLKSDGLHGLQRVCRVVSVVGAISAAAFGAVIFAFSDRLMIQVFGEEYGRYAEVAVLVSVANIVGSFGLGTQLSLKVRGLTRSLFGVRLACGALSIASVVVLAPHLGIVTAGWAVLVTSAANLLGLVYKSRTASGILEVGEVDVDADLPLEPAARSGAGSDP